MRILHTSDWHLGHALHDLGRDYEHARFIAWLVDVIEREAVDAVLMTGDVFDTANPPARAVAMWFQFLADARRRRPGLEVVVIAGNHDSAARLDAPDPVLRGLGVRVVGALPSDPDDCVVELHDARGEAAAVVAAVPYLRPGDLPAVAPDGDGDPLIMGVQAVYDAAIAAARARRRPGQALLATGHCFMNGTEVSRLSERRVLGGDLHALPVAIFPDDLAYVALGHMHKPQRVGWRDTVRYAGSPIPLAMNEAGYRHEVVVIDLDGERAADIRRLEVPRAVELLRVPRAPAPLAEVLAALEALPARDPAVAEVQRPFLEVRVALDAPQPSLRREIEAALVGKAARLVKLEVTYTGDGLALGDASPGASLRDLEPEQVFARRYRRDHAGDPPPELLAAFREAVDAARGAHDDEADEPARPRQLLIEERRA